MNLFFFSQLPTGTMDFISTIKSLTMASLASINITDPGYCPKNRQSKLNKLFASLLNDKRNMPFIYFMLLVILTTLPCAVVLFIPGMFHWWLAAVYFVFNTAFLMGRFILMQHNTAHKKLFNNKYKYLNNVIPWVLGPLFGLTPETYTAHHIGMHHPENNLMHDLSSTMKKKRDSCRDFTQYFIRFFFCVIPTLSFYLKHKKRKRLMMRMLAGESTWLLFTIILFFINPRAVAVVFIVPLVFTRFMMMAGNWAQHAFIDQDSPGNCYRNSITCINSNYNKQCWNDGYHTGHHLYPWLHWTEMPSEFVRNIEKYKSEDAIVFRKINYFSIWFLLMTKNYKLLSKYYVDLHEVPLTKEEVINLLKKRTKRCKL